MSTLHAAGYGLQRLAEIGKSLQATLARDMQAIRERDPAARSDIEIVTCYPGLHAVWLHRLAGLLAGLQNPFRIILQILDPGLNIGGRVLQGLGCVEDGNLAEERRRPYRR